MVSEALSEVISRAESLSQVEQLALIAHLFERMKHVKSEGIQLSWADLEGTLPYPALGEDAQEWISRSRYESDAQRSVR